MVRIALATLGILVFAACTKEPTPYGPENLWFHTTTEALPEAYQDGSQASGIGVGDVVPNFTLLDQHGDEVELYQFYGQVVQLVLFAQWCGPCQEEAPEVEAASVELAESGAVILEVMLQANEGPASVDASNEWVDEYGVTHPILADVSEAQSPMLQGGFPTLPLLDRELRIVSLDNWPFDSASIEQLAVDTAPEE
ncbi:MAG: peroxiredoxin [Myxococcota bacterium]